MNILDLVSLKKVGVHALHSRCRKKTIYFYIYLVSIFLFIEKNLKQNQYYIIPQLRDMGVFAKYFNPSHIKYRNPNESVVFRYYDKNKDLFISKLIHLQNLITLHIIEVYFIKKTD